LQVSYTPEGLKIASVPQPQTEANPPGIGR